MRSLPSTWLISTPSSLANFRTFGLADDILKTLFWSVEIFFVSFFISWVFLISFLNLGSLFAQVGGDNTYEFLNLTTSARISALGNVLVNSYDNDVNLAQQIPSLNHAGMNHQLALNFTNYYAGIKFGSLIYGIPSSSFENISIGIKYLNYGDFTRADEFGNVIGTFSAGEYAFFASTTIYKSTSFRFGTALKAVYSNMEAYNSYGLLADLSATYEFKHERTYASLLIKKEA